MFTYKHGLVVQSNSLNMDTKEAIQNGFRIKRGEKRYNCKGVLLPGKKQTVHKNEVSILCCCP